MATPRATRARGVLPARRSSHSQRLSQLAEGGVEVLADELSLRERGITDAALTKGVSPSPLDVIVNQLEDGRKAIWH